MIFADHAATTPVRREALEAMWPYLTGAFGNPSSRHGIGEEAAKSLLTYAFARDVVDRIKAEPVRHELEELLLARLPKGDVVRQAL